MRKITLFRKKLLNKIKNRISGGSVDYELQYEKEETKRLWIPDNPCISYIRIIIEELLKMRRQDYRDFYPVILDFDDPMEHTQEAFSLEAETDEADAIAKYELESELGRISDQLVEVLTQLASGLNRILIRTNRPAYFEDFVQTMYEETGLLVQTEPKEKQPFPSGSTVLDFEITGAIDGNGLRENILYLPIYKKPWEIAGNLDIVVPIGYNTVIVKGAIYQEKESDPDRFEREFYAK